MFACGQLGPIQGSRGPWLECWALLLRGTALKGAWLVTQMPSRAFWGSTPSPQLSLDQGPQCWQDQG